MKKIALTLAFVILLLCGCGIENGGRVLKSEISLQKNGIIESDYLKNLKKENAVAVFSGKSDGLSYSWTLFGSNIDSPADTDLRVRVKNRTDREIEIQIPGKGLGFTALLSLHIDTVWQVAEVLSGKDRIDATLTADGNSIINFCVSSGGNYTVRQAQEKYSNADGKKCTVSVKCTTAVNNIYDLKPEKLDVLPFDGILLDSTEVDPLPGESASELLERVCKEKHLHCDIQYTPMYDNYYIKGIGNIYEFDCGELSGWTYRVNGVYQSYGAGKYFPKAGDCIEFIYTCRLGEDIGAIK